MRIPVLYGLNTLGSVEDTDTSSDFVREILLPARVVPLKVSGIQLTEALLEFARACRGFAVVAKWTVGSLSKTGELVSIRIGQNASGARRFPKIEYRFRKLNHDVNPIQMSGHFANHSTFFLFQVRFVY
jgi:hypothetical protein